MNIQTIAEHSVATDLLTGGICIDVGCRGFQFSEAMRDLGCEVHSFDLEDFSVPDKIIFHRAAIIQDSRSAVKYVDTKDPQAKFVSEEGQRYVAAVSMSKLLNAFVIDKMTVDVLKLDCEGEEYKILSDPNFQPIPRQISVEFHEHCHKSLHDKYFNTCMENLLKYYEPVQHERYAAHGAGMNWWNSLFIRKDLL